MKRNRKITVFSFVLALLLVPSLAGAVRYPPAEHVLADLEIAGVPRLDVPFESKNFEINAEENTIGGGFMYFTPGRTVQFSINGTIDPGAGTFNATITGGSEDAHLTKAGDTSSEGQGRYGSVFNGEMNGSITQDPSGSVSGSGNVSITYTSSSPIWPEGEKLFEPPQKGRTYNGTFTLDALGEAVSGGDLGGEREPRDSDDSVEEGSRAEPAFSRASGAPPVPVTEARVTEIVGEAIIIEAGSGEEVQLTEGMRVGEGDVIMTGFESEVELDFGYADFTITDLTHVEVDKLSFSAGNISGTQVQMFVGAIRARIKPAAAIRSDFNVVTPTAITSVRGSEMIVAHDDEINETKVFVTEDEAFVRTPGGEEVSLNEGEKAVVRADTEEITPEPYTEDEVPAPLRTAGYGPMALATLAIAVLTVGLFVFYTRRKKHS